MRKEMLCSCSACAALAERYANDPQLLALYRKKLLMRGWAGRTDEVERVYILAHAPFAQAAAAIGGRNLINSRSHVSNAHAQTAPSVGAVSTNL